MINYLSAINPENIAGKTCLLRVDLNINTKTKEEMYRLDSTIPTIRFLQKLGCRIHIISHRGRPEGKDKKLSLRPFAKLLAKKVGSKVGFFPYCNPERREVQTKTQIVLFENLRFDFREEANDINFAKELAGLGDIYINDAFAVSHRENASVCAITKFLPFYGGLLLEKEIEHLDRAVKTYEPPLTLILGGIKIKDKGDIIKYFKEKANTILIGGGLANTFLKARGEDVKNSIVDEVKDIKDYLLYNNILLPEDIKFHDNKILDIGPKTIQKFANIISESKTIIWSGPIGMFEKHGYEKGTKGVWQAIIKNKTAFSLVGGGETTASIKLVSDFGFRISDLRNLYISTGGGAMLDYLSGKTLPGITALNK